MAWQSTLVSVASYSTSIVYPAVCPTWCAGVVVVWWCAGGVVVRRKLVVPQSMITMLFSDSIVSWATTLISSSPLCGKSSSSAC
jgi:hypothetical protein